MLCLFVECFMDHDIFISHVLVIMETLALLVATVAGFIEARKRRFDSVSTFIVGFVSAFGGGTVRDILLDRRPFYWVAHQNYALMVFFLSMIAPLLIRFSSKVMREHWLVVIDAIGLGLFGVLGTSIAIQYGTPYFTASLLGVITGVAGGVIRDILLNQVPWLLTNKQPYAICVFLGCWCFIILGYTSIDDVNRLLISSALVVVLRVLGWKTNFKIS